MMEFINVLLLLDFEPQLETLSPLFNSHLILLTLVFKLKSNTFGDLFWWMVRSPARILPSSKSRTQPHL